MLPQYLLVAVQGVWVAVQGVWVAPGGEEGVLWSLGTSFPFFPVFDVLIR
jgi:hypothetical protein